jgi:hypothetical protein
MAASARLFSACAFEPFPTVFCGSEMVIATRVQQRGAETMTDDSLAGDRDLLIGGQAICKFVNSLFDTERPITPAMIYFWVERNHLPVRRIGSRIVGSETAIRAHLCGSSGKRD